MMFTGTADGRVLKSENDEIETDHREVDWGQACAVSQQQSPQHTSLPFTQKGAKWPCVS